MKIDEYLKNLGLEPDENGEYNCETFACNEGSITFDLKALLIDFINKNTQEKQITQNSN